jgi:hypothetical protein
MACTQRLKAFTKLTQAINLLIDSASQLTKSSPADTPTVGCGLPHRKSELLMFNTQAVENSLKEPLIYSLIWRKPDKSTQYFERLKVDPMGEQSE